MELLEDFNSDVEGSNIYLHAITGLLNARTISY